MQRFTKGINVERNAKRHRLRIMSIHLLCSPPCGLAGRVFGLEDVGDTSLESKYDKHSEYCANQDQTPVSGGSLRENHGLYKSKIFV